MYDFGDSFSAFGDDVSTGDGSQQTLDDLLLLMLEGQMQQASDAQAAQAQADVDAQQQAAQQDISSSYYDDANYNFDDASKLFNDFAQDDAPADDSSGDGSGAYNDGSYDDGDAYDDGSGAAPSDGGAATPTATPASPAMPFMPSFGPPAQAPSQAQTPAAPVGHVMPLAVAMHAPSRKFIFNRSRT